MAENYETVDYNDDHNQSNKKQRRNVWTEKKNATLVELVKNCPFPTPWRPKHGTNKEIWAYITNQMQLRTDIFDRPIHWEAAKDHLIALIERQRLRRSVGDFEVKTDTERYIDEMITHTIAEDAEKAASLVRSRQRNTSVSNMSETITPRKRKTDDLGDSILGSDIDHNEEQQQQQPSGSYEREKLRLDFELQKEKIRISREREREDLLLQRDQEFMKFIQDQLSSSQALFQNTNDLLAKLLAKLESK